MKQQAERLYEAMCTGRRWKAADWQTYLLAHPVVGRLCQRVVWAWSTPASASPGTFRVLEDATLTDVDDSVVSLPDHAWVWVAHPITVGSPIAERWIQHLADYEVEPLFNQFARPPLRLPESMVQEQQIEDRKGYLIETFKLRGAATRLGWTRGQAEDGGWFCLYRKHFTAAGITAVLEFSGSPLPEVNHLADLHVLLFERNGPNGASEQALLGELPAPLLSECWNDLHEIAAQGTGEWEK